MGEAQSRINKQSTPAYREDWRPSSPTPSTTSTTTASHREAFQGTASDLQHKIEQTRSHMDGVLNELGERLHPSQLLAMGKSWWQERGLRKAERVQGQSGAALKEDASRVAHYVRHHMWSLGMISTGVALLLLSMDEQISRSASQGSRRLVSGGKERIRGATVGTASRIKNKVFAKAARWRRQASGTALRVKEQASGTASRLKEQASERALRFKEQAGGTGNRLSRQVDHERERWLERRDHGREFLQQQAKRTSEQFRANPLGMAGVVLGLGMAAGLLFPSSRREDELMGEASSQVKKRAAKLADQSVRSGIEQAHHEVEQQGGAKPERSSGSQFAS